MSLLTVMLRIQSQVFMLTWQAVYPLILPALTITLQCLFIYLFHFVIKKVKIIKVTKLLETPERYGSREWWCKRIQIWDLNTLPTERLFGKFLLFNIDNQWLLWKSESCLCLGLFQQLRLAGHTYLSHIYLKIKIRTKKKHIILLDSVNQSRGLSVIQCSLFTQ